MTRSAELARGIAATVAEQIEQALANPPARQITGEDGIQREPYTAQRILIDYLTHGIVTGEQATYARRLIELLALRDFVNAELQHAHQAECAVDPTHPVSV